MCRHLPVGAAILLLSLSPLAASNASAQSSDQLPRVTKLLFLPSESGGSIPPPVAAEPRDVVEDGQTANASSAVTERSRSLMPLYISTAALQALDIHSTLQV